MKKPIAYRHYKGNVYLVISDSAKNSRFDNAKADTVVYYDPKDGQVYYQMAKRFSGKVRYNGKLVQRFTKVNRGDTCLQQERKATRDSQECQPKSEKNSRAGAVLKRKPTAKRTASLRKKQKPRATRAAKPSGVTRKKSANKKKG